MQTTSWFQAARCPGAFRYHYKRLGFIVLLVLAVITVTQLIALAFPLFIDMEYQLEGVDFDIAMALMVSCIMCIGTASKPTRFLLRFGTPRLSVWLCTLLSLIAAAIAFLLGTFVVNLLIGGLTNALGAWKPGSYAMSSYSTGLTGTELLRQSIAAAFSALPRYLLYTAEWTCLFYLLGCCFARNRVATLCVIVGVPLLFSILMIFPAARQLVSTLKSADQGQMTVLGLQWMQFFSRAVEFIRKQWPLIQFLAALISLPLSYLCMRGTAQPAGKA